MERRVTLKDLANATGFTVATVSRALSGKDQIAAETRQTVREAAERLGYRPDPALARLAAWRWGAEGRVEQGNTLAILTDEPNRQLPSYARRRVEGAQSRAGALGYGVDLFRLDDYQGNTQRLAEILRSRGIQGVLVERVNRPGIYRGFPWAQFAAVSCGLGEEHLPIPTVTNDTYAALRMLWSRARHLGYRRIGLVLTFGGKPDPYFRMLAAARLEQTVKLPDEIAIEPLILEKDQPPQEQLDQMLPWLERHQVDVIFGSPRVFELLEQAGIAPPRDLPFACFAKTESTPREVTGARPHLFHVGELAADLCHMLLQRPAQAAAASPKVLHLIEPEWIPGHTMPEACPG